MVVIEKDETGTMRKRKIRIKEIEGLWFWFHVTITNLLVEGISTVIQDRNLHLRVNSTVQEIRENY